MAESMRKAWERDPSQFNRRVGYSHSEETKRKITDSLRRRSKEDPEYHAKMKGFALKATRAARSRFLSSLADTSLTLGAIPLTKADEQMVRALPCALCRTVDQPRELAHIIARSQGGPSRHVWGNAVPLCRKCHDSVDHGTVNQVGLA